MYQNQQGAPNRVIETASATTSPDNVNSGTRPYLIVVIGLIALMLLSTALGGCMSATLKSAYYLIEDDVASIDWEDSFVDDYEYDYHDYHDYQYDYDLDEYDLDNFDFDEYEINDMDFDLDLDDPDGLDEVYRFLEERDGTHA